MRVWYFSEMAYHPAWEEGLKRGSLRVVLPNANYDPKVGHQLLNRYLDEFRLCDEVGLDIMVNEHHSTSTCLTISVPMALAVIARETKRARLLSLGTPIANRPDPVRVAEEMAWLDVLSGGRLEMGLVKGAPYEIAPANSNPGRLMRRYWEAHDLIIKALSTTTGPFSWEGEFYQYRAVNIWPRPIQQPTPPIWICPPPIPLARFRSAVSGVPRTHPSPRSWRCRLWPTQPRSRPRSWRRMDRCWRMRPPPGKGLWRQPRPIPDSMP